MSERLKWCLSFTFMGLFMAFVLPLESATLRAFVGDTQAPDTRFFYNAATLMSIAEAFGEAGRRAYVLGRLRFDIVWPIVYGSFGYFSLKPWVRGRFRPFVLALPWLAVAFDLCENSMVSWVFFRYPQASVFASVAGVMTVLKWVTLTTALSLIPILSLQTLITRRR